MKIPRLLQWVKEYRLSRIFIWQQLMIFIFFIIPLLAVSGFVYWFSRDIIDRNMRDNAVSSLERFRDVFDAELASSAASVTRLAINPDVLHLFETPTLERNFQLIERIRRIQNQIGAVLGTFRIVNSIYVYVPFHDYLIQPTSAGAFRNNPALAWNEDMVSNAPTSPQGTQIVLSESRSIGDTESILILARTSNVSLDRTRGIVVAVISSPSLKKLFESIVGDGDNLLMLALRNNVYAAIVDKGNYASKDIAEIKRIANQTAIAGSRIVSINGTPSLITQTTSNQMGSSLILTMPLTWYQQRYNTLNHVLVLLISLSLLLALGLSVAVSLSLFRPLHRILAVLNTPPRMLYVPGPDAGLIMRNILGRSDAVRTVDTEREIRDRIETFKSAQAIALQSQINPHFLYNTLETVNWSVMRMTGGPNEASQLLSLLSRLLRLSLRQDAYLVPLSEEMEQIGLFIQIQHIRYIDSLKFTVDVPAEVLSCKIPKLTLQPLIENALHHGIRPREHSGTISIGAKINGEQLILSVKDDGVGMTRNQLTEIRKAMLSDAYLSGVHVGLANVHQRIKILFGDEYGLKLYSKSGSGTRIMVTLPRL